MAVHLTLPELKAARETYRQYWDYYADPKEGFIRWIEECVYTSDEEANVDAGEEPVKKFPSGKSYVKYAVEHGLLSQRLLCIPKSRRMIATWVVAAYALWFAIFKEKRNVLWQAQTAKKSANTLEEKMLFILEHIPYDKMAPWVSIHGDKAPEGWDERLVNYYRPKRGPEGLIELGFVRRGQRDSGEEFYYDDSTIYAVAEGEHQWRQFTVSLGIQDEFAFFQNPFDSQKGARPAVGTKGQLIVLSSANPGYMAEMIKEPDYGLTGERPPQPTPEHPGIRTWYSDKGYFVLWLHYTADESKRGHDWTEWSDPTDPDRGKPGSRGYARQGFDRKQWQQEMEIDFSVHQGEPFYPEWSDADHRRRIRPVPNYPVVLGFDFGITPATTIWQILPSGHIIGVGELVSFENGIEQHCDELELLLNARFPWWNSGNRNKSRYRSLADPNTGWLEKDDTPKFRDMVISYCDPAGFQRAQTDLRTPIEILQKRGFNPQESQQDPVARQEAMKWALTHLHKYSEENIQLPTLLADPSMEFFIEGMRGGCKISKTSRFKKEKNDWSHVVESAEYVMVMQKNFNRILRRATGQERRNAHVQKNARYRR